MEVAPYEARSHFLEPLEMVEETEVLFDLDMSKVMPVADGWW
jgi:hypothetical protein